VFNTAPKKGNAFYILAHQYIGRRTQRLRRSFAAGIGRLGDESGVSLAVVLQQLIADPQEQPGSCNRDHAGRDPR